MAKTATKSKKTKDEDVEVEVVEDDDVELEALDADVEEEDEKPKGKSKSKKESSNGSTDVTFGVADLAKYLSKKTKKDVTTRELRAQIRRMAREDKPRVNRDIVPGNRTRYDWPKGLEDPEVKAIVKAWLGGEAEEAKKAKLAELKTNKASKQAAKAAKKGKKGSKKAKDEAEIEVDED